MPKSPSKWLCRPQYCNFIEKKTLAQVLSCDTKFWEQIFHRTPPVAASAHSPPQRFSKKKTMTFFFHGCLWLLLKIRNSELLTDLMLLPDMMIMHLFPIVDNLYSKNAEKLGWQCHEKLAMTKNGNLFCLMKSTL